MGVFVGYAEPDSGPKRFGRSGLLSGRDSVSSADLGRGAHVRGPDEFRWTASGPRTSGPLPKTEPEAQNRSSRSNFGPDMDDPHDRRRVETLLSYPHEARRHMSKSCSASRGSAQIRAKFGDELYVNCAARRERRGFFRERAASNFSAVFAQLDSLPHSRPAAHMPRCRWARPHPDGIGGIRPRVADAGQCLVNAGRV